MHFEILVEDASGKIIIDNIMDKLCSNMGGNITHRTIPYKGIGRLPKNLNIQDNICDTWEMLANVIYSSRAKGLKAKGYPEIGIAKREWAERISPYMSIENNQSPSFQYFVRKIRELVRSA